MRSTITAVAAAGLLALASVSVPNEARADCRGCGGFGLGLLGGLAAGAIIGGAVAHANSYPAYAPAPGYAPYGAYTAPGPVGCPGGYWARRPLRDPYGNVVGWSRPRFFCPAG